MVSIKSSEPEEAGQPCFFFCYFRVNVHVMKAPITTLIIPAAGIGSRLQPLTPFLPKEMLRLVDKPIFYYLLQEAYLARITRVIFIIHQKNQALKKYLSAPSTRSLLADFPGLTVSFIETPDRFGDGHALLQAKDLVANDKAFAVTMGDLLSLPGKSIIGELIKVYEQNPIPLLSVEKIERSKTERYGIIDPKTSDGRLYRINSIVEKPKPNQAPSLIAMTGKYILTPKIFSYLEKLMRQRTVDEIKLSYALRDYSHDYPLNAYRCQSRHYDTGVKSGLLKTELAFALAHPDFGPDLRRYLNQLSKTK